MLCGVEIITPQVDSLDNLGLPLLVKARTPSLYGDIRRVVPTAMIMSRPESEGLSTDEIFDSFMNWFWTVPGTKTSWLIHEMSNEPNHPNHDDYWNQRGGPEAYEIIALDALSRIHDMTNATHLCALGGLVPYKETSRWAAIYDRIQARFPQVGRCAHIYAKDRFDDVSAQLSGKLSGSFITEAGISQDYGPPAIEANAFNFMKAASLGVRACALFVHKPGPNGEWDFFVYPDEAQKYILDAGRTEQNQDMTFEEVWNEYQNKLGPFPKLDKVAAEDDLGKELENQEHDYEVDGRTYRVKFFIRGLAYVPVGQWEKARTAQSLAELTHIP